MQHSAVSGGSDSIALFDVLGGKPINGNGSAEKAHIGNSGIPQKAKFFLRTNERPATNNNYSLAAVPLEYERAKLYMDKNSISYNLDVTGTYEGFVKTWLLSNNIPAMYELKFVLDDRYMHTPDFITGILDERGRIVIINPHKHLDDGFMKKQKFLLEAGFHIIIIYNFDRVEWDERDKYTYATEYLAVNGSAEHDINNFLDRKLAAYKRISKEELFDKILKMKVEPMAGNPLRLLRDSND